VIVLSSPNGTGQATEERICGTAECEVWVMPKSEENEEAEYNNKDGRGLDLEQRFRG